VEKKTLDVFYGLTNMFEMVNDSVWRSLTVVVPSQHRPDEYYCVTLTRDVGGVIGTVVRCSEDGTELKGIDYLSEKWYYSLYSWYQGSY
jgi:hypothetical protein